MTENSALKSSSRVSHEGLRQSTSRNVYAVLFLLAALVMFGIGGWFGWDVYEGKKESPWELVIPAALFALIFSISAIWNTFPDLRRRVRRRRQKMRRWRRDTFGF